MLFDFSTAHYSAAPERDRCLLQIWSEEGNIVRRAASAGIKNGILKLSVFRFGQSKPSRMEICAQAERRSPSALKAMRAAYQRTLERTLPQVFPGWTLDRCLILAPEIYANPWLLRDDEFSRLARIYNLHRHYRDILVNGMTLPETVYGPYAVSRGDGHGHG